MKAQHDTFHFNMENTNFFGQSWKTQNPKAVIVLVHGMGEHSSRYEGFFTDFFTQNNIAIITFDQYGHGKTEGKRGHTPGYEYNIKSIHELLKIASNKFEGLPLFLYGHSMGGNLVANFILKESSSISGAIVSSPMLRLAFVPPAWKMKVGGLLRNIYPSFTENTGLDITAISRDTAEVEKYKTDALVHDKITINYSLPFFEAGEWAIANAKKLKLKTFVFHGSGDQITDSKATEVFAKNAGGNAKLKIYEGAYHELHNELCKQEVLSDVLEFIQNNI